MASSRYGLVVLDYRNSYYGRLALKELGGRTPQRTLVRDRVEEAPVPAGPDEASGPGTKLPSTRSVIRDLIALGLYDQALDELKYAQKMWGDSPAVLATQAWIYRQQGRAETGTKQFNLYRASINAMRRAYPQFMAAGGEKLPDELLRIIFPLAYWDEIRRNAADRGLDPYVVAALIAQESTFVPDIRSAANAVGLMPLVPSTARQYARRMRVRYSSKLLTDPASNLQLGSAYFADKVREFGDLYLALASYNAAERAVYRWTAERPGVACEQFIDDIPYPETQNYVRKILGTTEDYRRLGGRHAGRGRDRVQRKDLAGRRRHHPQREAARRRALHARLRGHHPLRRHRGRSRGTRAALAPARDLPAAPERAPARVRVHREQRGPAAVRAAAGGRSRAAREVTVRAAKSGRDSSGL